MSVLARTRPAILRLSILGLAVIAVSGAAAAPPDPDPPGVVPAAQSAPVVTVDVAADPATAAALLSAPTAFEGMTVSIEGVTVDDPATRRARDLELSRNDAPIAPPQCPDIPDGARFTNGATQAYLGCDPSTGQQSARPAVPGAPATTLPTAFDQVLAAGLGSGLPPTSVQITGRDVIVALPEEAGKRAFARPVADVVALDRALLFTAHSNGAVGSVQFTVAGDCLRYALAFGGDACATVTLPVTVEQDDAIATTPVAEENR